MLCRDLSFVCPFPNDANYTNPKRRQQQTDDEINQLVANVWTIPALVAIAVTGWANVVVHFFILARMAWPHCLAPNRSS